MTIALIATVLIVGTTICGCLDAPIVPVTPANAQQVSQCQGAASLHNGLVFGDYVVGGGGAVTGVVSAALPASDVSAKTDLAIAGAVAAGVATLGAGFAALESHAYAADKCSALIEPLFDTRAPKAVAP